VVEVVSGDCIIIVDDALQFGSPSVHVADGSNAQAGSADSRVIGFGSVFLLSEAKGSEDVNSTTATPLAAATQQPGLNIVELIIARGFGTVIRHREFEEHSNHYENLLAAESCATTRRKGIHSAKDPPSMHVTDLLAGSTKKAKDFLPFLQRKRRMTVVEYVLSGHRFKLFVPNETCSIAFSLSGVRCPGRDEPYSNDAISLMRRKIMQRNVEIEVETVARTGTFIGSLWESKTNVEAILLEGYDDPLEEEKKKAREISSNLNHLHSGLQEAKLISMENPSRKATTVAGNASHVEEPMVFDPANRKQPPFQLH
ncbi:ribonuclease TUDOR 1-like protein, partial [Tanacetum coccineum]